MDARPAATVSSGVTKLFPENMDAGFAGMGRANFL